MKYLLLILFVVSCNSTPPVEVKRVEEVKPIVSTSVEVPVIVLPPASAPLTPKKTIADITLLAEKSSCASYHWLSRGLAPTGYIEGMALAYGHEVCFPNKVVSSAILGTADNDVLTHYGLKGNSLNVYAILIGSGMIESSGRYCSGRDTSANNTSSATAEAGMFQTSYSAHSASPELDVLFNDFKNNPKNCLDIFKEKVSCSQADLTNFGSGDGLKFQQMTKDCPMFAVQFAAVTSRVLYRHYGPLRRKTAEYKKECVDMLSSVETEVKENPELCNNL